MGRKRNQGKARRAAKAEAAKAREEAEASRGYMSQMTTNEHSEGTMCTHGADTLSSRSFFLEEFRSEFEEALRRCNCVLTSLEEAYNATMNEFADMWNDSTKLILASSLLLRDGTNSLIEDYYNDARDAATFARFFEQHIAVMLNRTQALINWAKLDETFYSDDHTLVKFFRHRIPCSCMDEKYEEVKSITKIGFCFAPNPQCSSGRYVDRSKTKYCSRCRCATYCSRECQVADWSRHKPHCDRNAAIIAKFEAAKRQK